MSDNEETLEAKARAIVEYVLSTDRADAEFVVLTALEEAALRATEAARAEERERAARVAERLDGLPETYHAPVFRHMIADAIRAGGKP